MALTVLLVEQYLDLFLLVGLETGVNASDRLAVRQLAGHERTVCSSLHDLSPAVAAQLTEPATAPLNDNAYKCWRAVKNPIRTYRTRRYSRRRGSPPRARSPTQNCCLQSVQRTDTIETRVVSVYHTYVPRRTRRRSQSWNKHVSSRSRYTRTIHSRLWWNVCLSLTASSKLECPLHLVCFANVRKLEITRITQFPKPSSIFIVFSQHNKRRLTSVITSGWWWHSAVEIEILVQFAARICNVSVPSCTRVQATRVTVPLARAH